MEQHSGFLMDEPTWGQRVKSVRLKLNFTQVRLAEELEMNAITVARWENTAKRPYSESAEKFMQLESEIAEQEAGGVS